MANKSGNAYGLTVLCPILQGLPKHAPDGMTWKPGAYHLDRAVLE